MSTKESTAEFEDFKVQGATELVTGKIIAGATVPKVIFKFAKSPTLGVAEGVGVDVAVGFGVGEAVAVGFGVGDGVGVGVTVVEVVGVGVGIGLGFTVIVVETVFD